jgi:hypothetical protein
MSFAKFVTISRRLGDQGGRVTVGLQEASCAFASALGMGRTRLHCSFCRRTDLRSFLNAKIEDGNTGYMIERALDEARSQQFTPKR